jgi:heat shock protein HslJ
MNRMSLLVATIALVGACSSAGGSSGTPATLDGHTYLSTGIAGAELVPGTQVRLSFVDGNLNASAGCNMMGGTYSVDGDRLVSTQLWMTEMGCDEQRARQDEWLAGYLSSTVTIALDGVTLTLTDGTVTLTLLDEEVATPDQPLEGTLWILDGITAGDTGSSIPAGVTASIRIAAGQVALQAGCNQGGGAVEVTPDALTFGPMMLTKMACEPGPMDVENAMTTVLSGPVAYSIDAGRLTLNTGQAGLMFRAAP